MDEFDANGLARIGDAVRRAVEQGHVPGVVAAVAAGGAVHVEAAGRLALDGTPMRADSLFRIASITKPMTAAVVLSCIEDGLLRFDDPVEQFIPELADRRVLRRPDGPLDDTVPAARPFTIRDALTFTWGFGMQGAMFASEPWPIYQAAQELGVVGPPQPDSTPAAAEWLDRLASLPLIAQPGERWLYSAGSQLLGIVIARATGMPFEQAIRERLFAPLGMSDTGFWTPHTDRLATAYVREQNEWQVFDAPNGQWSHAPLFADGAAGLVSSARDVVAFGRMLLRGGAGVLRPEMVAEMVEDRLTPEQRTYDWPGPDLLEGRGWGYGLSILDDGRYCWDGGLGTAWSNVPALDLTVVVLTQRAWDESGPPGVCAEVLDLARSAVR